MQGLGLMVLLLGYASASQLTPVPTAGQAGYVLGPANSTYTLDVYYDHLCSASAGAFPGLWKYWEKNSDWLQLNIHIFPLPYHHFSFEVAEAGHFIQVTYPERFIDFTAYFFNHQNTYLSDAVAWDYNTTLSRLANDTQTATGVPSGEVLAALANSANNYSTRVAWKYGCSKGVTGTPTYLVNGVVSQDASGNESVKSWKKFFKKVKK
jgi:protein-disulfide isomerase